MSVRCGVPSKPSAERKDFLALKSLALACFALAGLLKESQNLYRVEAEVGQLVLKNWLGNATAFGDLVILRISFHSVGAGLMDQPRWPPAEGNTLNGACPVPRGFGPLAQFLTGARILVLSWKALRAVSLRESSEQWVPLWR